MTGSQSRKDVPHFEAIASAGETKPWITMVHGASQHSGLFSAQVEAFEADYRLLLIDLPGHGRSSAVPGPYGLAEYARSVLAAIQAAQVERTHFWGTHTGAGIALMLAAQHPPLIASLVLDDAIRARPAECRAKAHWDMVAGFSGRPWTDPSQAEPVSPIRPALARIAQPVLLVNGEHDVEDFIRVADEIESTLSNVQRVTVPGAGGFPLWECPAEVNALVRQFLARQAG